MGCFHYAAAIVVCGGSFLIGLALGWTVSFSLLTVKYTFPISPEELSWVSNFFTIGATIACIPTGWLSEWIGRKRTMMLMVIPFAIGWIILTFGNSVFKLCIGRLLSGIAGGAYSVVTPFYVCEISETDIRGKLCTVHNIMIAIGILASYLIGSNWSLYGSNMVTCFACVAYVLLLLWLPESPVYLVSKDMLPEAKKSLMWFNREESYNPSEDIRVIQNGLTEDLNGWDTILFAVNDSATRKAMLITVGLMAIQQFCGINGIIYYSFNIFENIAVDIDAKTLTLSLGMLNFIATFVAYYLVDVVGCIFLLLVSCGMQICSNIGMMIYFSEQENNPESTEEMVWLPMVSLGCFIFFFSCGLGPVPWLMCGELFSTRTKSYAGTLATTTHWLCAFLMTEAFPIIVEEVGQGGTFAICSFSSLISVLFIIFFVRETKGKTLNEIQAILA